LAIGAAEVLTGKWATRDISENPRPRVSTGVLLPVGPSDGDACVDVGIPIDRSERPPGLRSDRRSSLVAIAVLSIAIAAGVALILIKS